MSGLPHILRPHHETLCFTICRAPDYNQKISVCSRLQRHLCSNPELIASAWRCNTKKIPITTMTTAIMASPTRRHLPRNTQAKSDLLLLLICRFTCAHERALRDPSCPVLINGFCLVEMLSNQSSMIFRSAGVHWLCRYFANSLWNSKWVIPIHDRRRNFYPKPYFQKN